MKKDLEVDVKMENEKMENFEFDEVNNEVSEKNKMEMYRRKRVYVKEKSGYYL
jgi:hypothetical protein